MAFETGFNPCPSIPASLLTCLWNADSSGLPWITTPVTQRSNLSYANRVGLVLASRTNNLYSLPCCETSGSAMCAPSGLRQAKCSHLFMQLLPAVGTVHCSVYIRPHHAMETSCSASCSEAPVLPLRSLCNL